MTAIASKDHPFRVVLIPHRSLPPKGFIILMTVIVAVSFAAGTAFLLMGAWPVLGFFGLDVLLIYWAFKASFRASDHRETVDVTDHEVIVRRLVPHRPVQELRFARQWVRVELEEDADRELIGSLRLFSHGRAYEVGGFLSPDDRKSFATALKAAIAVPRI